MKQNVVGWFEIPVTDMDRAKAFYEKLLDIKITVHDFGGVVMGWFPSSGQAYGATGSLMKHEAYIPSDQGSLVYFSSEDVQIELNRAVNAGGTILQKKTLISEEHGFMALLKDSEGNRIALHSLK
tara:strand:+ start:1008 stop:1382 length:375 start_codon:yes stop_codon:yes gene_type:complete